MRLLDKPRSQKASSTPLWLLLLTLLAAVPLLTSGQARAQDPPADKTITVGVVFDGPTPGMQQLWGEVQKEILQLAQDDLKIEFPARAQLFANWTKASARQSFLKLHDDDTVDMVVAFGPLTSDAAVYRRGLRKPVVAPFVVDARLQGLIQKGKKIRRRRLSYVVWSLDLERDLKVFKEVGDFKKIAFLSDGSLLNELPVVKESLLRSGKASGVELVPVSVAADPEAAIKSLGKDIDAVYIGPLPRLDLAGLDKLLKLINGRRLPSFSFIGRAVVDRGALLGLASPSDRKRLIRRVSLNIDSILRGDDPRDLVNSYKQTERLVMNMRTAKALGISPSWSLLTEAELMHKQPSSKARRVSLRSIAKAARRTNLNLNISRADLLIGEQDIDGARANLLPRLEASLSGSWIDADRAGFGNAERTVQWSATLTQTIYSQQAWAGLAIQQKLQEARKHQVRASELDAVYLATTAYLDILRAKTAERIQRENLRLTRENLALARARTKTGVSAANEVIRWEAAIANSQRDTIRSIANRNIAEMALNRLLNRPVEESFVTAETSLKDSAGMVGHPRFQKLVNNPRRFRLVREFLVKRGLKSAPEVTQFGPLLAAKDAEVEAYALAPFVPTFGLQGSVTHQFYRGGAGSEGIDTTDPNVQPFLPLLNNFPSPDKLNWQVGINMSLPLYEGGARYARTRRARRQRSQMKLQQDNAKQLVEQRIRSALHSAGASLSAVGLNQRAAAASAKNLKLVTDAYSKGATTILQLLDAQNQALIARLAATNAEFDAIIDVMELERAIGVFSFSQSDKQITDLLKEMAAYVNRNERGDSRRSSATNADAANKADSASKADKGAQ